MDLLLDRSFQVSVPLKVPALKSGKKTDPSLAARILGLCIERFVENSLFYKWLIINNYPSRMSAKYYKVMLGTLF